MRSDQWQSEHMQARRKHQAAGLPLTHLSFKQPVYRILVRMSEERNPPGTSGTSDEAASVDPHQMVRVSDLQATVDAMVKRALEAAGTTPSGSRTDGESPPRLFFSPGRVDTQTG